MDVIIHCAWPARPPETNDSLASYVENTVELTCRLLEQPHDKFIFVSTAEVYPLQGHTGEEDQPIATERVRNLYAHTKLMAEALVRERGRNALILRCTGLLGPTARPSSLIRILRENRHTLTLSLESRFCHVLHEDVTAFILAAIERNLAGIYSLCSSESVTLGEVARSFGRNVSWEHSPTTSEWWTTERPRRFAPNSTEPRRTSIGSLGGIIFNDLFEHIRK